MNETLCIYEANTLPFDDLYGDKYYIIHYRDKWFYWAREVRPDPYPHFCYTGVGIWMLPFSGLGTLLMQAFCPEEQNVRKVSWLEFLVSTGYHFPNTIADLERRIQSGYGL